MGSVVKQIEANVYFVECHLSHSFFSFIRLLIIVFVFNNSTDENILSYKVVKDVFLIFVGLIETSCELDEHSNKIQSIESDI